MAKGNMISLTASDGHKLGAYKAVPSGTAKGAVVILQEIFGVNGHVKHLCEEFAGDGYVAVAPAIFDRVEPNLDIGYGEIGRARDIVGKLTEAMLLADMQAAIDEAAKESGMKGMVVPIGYCFGGALAYLAASKNTGIAGAVNYYGTRTIQYCETMTPKVPVQYHFGTADKSIPPEAITKIKSAHPIGLFYIYEGADHGFSCDDRPQFYNADATKLAKERTLHFLGDVLQ
ncbi:MAG: dienelactone hydrolase family protein [Rhodobacteraceae bacterium]|nr:dienelactone hydrolase family protein [Paracoccaceae bacterium]